MKQAIFIILFLFATIIANAQTKGAIDFLDFRPGIYPVMVNDSVTKHMRILTPLSIEGASGVTKLHSDYCVMEEANLAQVNAVFDDIIISSIMFFVNPDFNESCLAALKRTYGEPIDADGMFIWESDKYILNYTPQPSKMPKGHEGQSYGVFRRKSDLTNN